MGPVSVASAADAAVEADELLQGPIETISGDVEEAPFPETLTKKAAEEDEEEEARRRRIPNNASPSLRQGAAMALNEGQKGGQAIVVERGCTCKSVAAMAAVLLNSDEADAKKEEEEEEEVAGTPKERLA